MSLCTERLLVLALLAVAAVLCTINDSCFVAAQKRRFRKKFKSLPLCSTNACACFKKCRNCRPRRGACRTGQRSVICCGGGQTTFGGGGEEPAPPPAPPPGGQPPPVQPPPPPPPGGQQEPEEPESEPRPFTFGSLFNPEQAVPLVSNDEFTYYDSDDFNLFSDKKYSYEEYYEEDAQEALPSRAQGAAAMESRLADPCKSFLEVVQGRTELATFRRVLQNAPQNVRDEVADKEAKGTLLAPSNAAFDAQATGDELQEFLDDEVAVYNLLTQHAIPGVARLTTDFAQLPTPVNTTNTRPLATVATVDSSTGAVDVSFTAPFGGESAGVATGDLRTCNGLVHILDGVLVPGNNVTATGSVGIVDGGGGDGGDGRSPPPDPGFELPEVLLEKLNILKAVLRDGWIRFKEKLGAVRARYAKQKGASGGDDSSDHDSSDL